MNPATIVRPLLRWFAGHARDLPWRQTLDPYGVWISEIMLQQTQVKTVIPYWEHWMHTLPDVSALARAPLDQVLKLWEGLGYYTRARNLQKAAHQIVERNSGVFPQRFDEVLALPGIGRYTAGAICSIAYNQPTPILDGNVIRVMSRLFALGGDPRERATNEALWKLAETGVRAAAALDPSRAPKSAHPSPSKSGGALRPKTFPVSGLCSAFNQALMELGALICTPKQPNCAICPLRLPCRARATGQVDRLPNLGPRATMTDRAMIALAVEHQGRWLMHRRPPGGVNAHLWEFPSLETKPSVAAFDPETLRAQIHELRGATLKPLPVIRHSITRYRITVRPVLVLLSCGPARRTPGAWRALGDVCWQSAAQIEGLALTSAHRRLWRSIKKSVLVDGSSFAQAEKGERAKDVDRHAQRRQRQDPRQVKA